MLSRLHLVVLMGGVSVPCLIDTGSMVSTITKVVSENVLSLGTKNVLRHAIDFSLGLLMGCLSPTNAILN